MKALLPILISFYCAGAWGWGSDGHKIVARIAENNLSAEAKKKIGLILDNESLPNVSVWADIVKFTPLWWHTSDWHFMDLPDDFNPSSTALPPNSAGSAIKEMTAQLKDPSKTVSEKRQALKFLIHFVGDIHQPLHVGRLEDRGGNDVDVIYNGDHMNLHKLWDIQLVEDSGMDYNKYSAYLQTYFFFSGKTKVVNFPFSEVILENLGARKAIYDFHSVNGRITLDKNYLAKNKEFLNRSLYLGGMRLAALLNGIFQ